MFFILSKILAPLLQPIYHICGAVFIAWLAIWLKRTALAKGLLSYSLVILLIFGIMPTGYNMLVYLEGRYETAVINNNNPPDGIIVMGGAMDEALSTLYGQVVAYDSFERMTAFLELARRFENNETKLAFTGGSAALLKKDGQRDLTEAEAAALFFMEQSFPVERIIFEDKSRTTFENAKYCNELFTPSDNENWIVVTSAFHMPRTINVFKAQGWDIKPYPVDYRTDLKYVLVPNLDILKNLNYTRIAIHEWVGNAIYYLSGKSASFLP
jgi:uncharacterized SAM-binding protein YcdF (DUF218 family)